MPFRNVNMHFCTESITAAQTMTNRSIQINKENRENIDRKEKNTYSKLGMYQRDIGCTDYTNFISNIKAYHVLTCFIFCSAASTIILVDAVVLPNMLELFVVSIYLICTYIWMFGLSSILFFFFFSFYWIQRYVLKNISCQHYSVTSLQC